MHNRTTSEAPVYLRREYTGILVKNLRFFIGFDQAIPLTIGLFYLFWTGGWEGVVGVRAYISGNKDCFSDLLYYLCCN